MDEIPCPEWHYNGHKGYNAKGFKSNEALSDLSNYPSHFELNGCSIGDGFPTFVIAEVAQSHDGSLDLAHTYIDAAADAGANAIKFQAHIASEESTLDENFRVKFSSQDKTRYDYWKRMEFSFDEWKQLIAHAETRGLVFLCSPFSLAAVSMLRNLVLLVGK